VAGALDILAGLPLASSRSLTLCDPASVACVEILDNQLRLIDAGPAGRTAPDGGPEPGGLVMHTNHYLHPDFAAGDLLNVFARNSSVLRLKACDAGLAGIAQAGGHADIEEHFAMLAQPPICVADAGDIRREKTVAAVVLLPDRGELHVRPGDPARSSTQAFGLRPGSGQEPAR
jgi:isopenicillin-N N-acyltransferase-like protein